MHATGVTKKIEIESWVPSEKNKCKQRNVGSRVKRQFSLGGNGMLHLPNGIRKIFKLHYWTKTSMKYKKKVESELVRYCFKCLRLESSRGIRIFSNLSQISNTTVLFHLHPNDLREIQCRKLIKALAFKLGERFSTLLCRWGKGKNQLIINHEFIKEAKTTSARFEKLNFRV